MLAQAAALAAKAARLSERQLTLARAASVAQEADRIRAEAASLIDEDSLAYARVLEQGRRPPGPERSAGLAAALSDAADVPLRVVELAVPTAGLAAALIAGCKPALRGDAVAAGELAQAAAKAAAALVTINLAGTPEDPRHDRASAMLAAISSSLAQPADGRSAPG